MSINIGKEKGSTTVSLGGQDKKLEFEYEYIKDGNGSNVTFQELVDHLVKSGFTLELPSKDEIEKLKEENKGIRGKVAEPRSLTRILLSGVKDYAYQDSRATCIDEAVNTEEAQSDKAVNELVNIAIRTSSEKVARLTIAGFIGMADENKALVTSALKKISEHKEAKDFLKGLALEALTGLTE